MQPGWYTQANPGSYRRHSLALPGHLSPDRLSEATRIPAVQRLAVSPYLTLQPDADPLGAQAEGGNDPPLGSTRRGGGSTTTRPPWPRGRPPRRIEDYLCLALYTASRSVTGLYRDLLDGLGLTYPQYLVMRLLSQQGPQPVKDIASVLRLD